MLRARLVAAGGFVLLAAAVCATSVLLDKHTMWATVAAVAFIVLGLGGAAVAAAALSMAGLIFEWNVRRRFRAVCRQKGLAARNTTIKGREQWYYPAVGRLEGTSSSFRLVIQPLLGQSHADWDKAAAAFTLAYGATAARLRHDGTGKILMNVGYEPIDAHEFEHRPLASALVARNWQEPLRRVEVGKAEGGQPFMLPLLGSHILIAGITGSGKGSLLWSILLRLVPAAETGAVRFWGFDPKRMELAIGRGFFGDRYAAGADEMVALLERAHAEMMARADALAGQVRKFRPSREHPLEVLVVDELGYLVALLPDRKQREYVEKLLSAVLALGRAVGFAVIGALQDPRKETLSFRDLFPTRVAMRLSKPMVDLVLGAGMYEAGAQCDLIPATEEDGAGVAFVVDESSTLPVMLRTSWCSDEVIIQAAAQLSAPSFRRLSVVSD